MVKGHAKDTLSSNCTSSEGKLRANGLALMMFEDPARKVEPTPLSRISLLSAFHAGLREVYELAERQSLPNLPSSISRDILLEKLVHLHPEELLEELVTALATRDKWREEAQRFEFSRIRERYQTGPIRQQGHDEKGRPIVWVLRYLERRNRDWSHEKHQSEYASSISWAIDSAIRRHVPSLQNGHGVSLFIVDHHTPVLNFGRRFVSTLSRNLATAFLVPVRIVQFAPSSSTLIMTNQLDRCRPSVTVETISSIEWDAWSWKPMISDLHLLPSSLDGFCSGGNDLASNHLLDDIPRRAGFETPLSIADIFLSRPDSADRLVPEDDFSIESLVPPPRTGKETQDEETPNLVRQNARPALGSMGSSLAVDHIREWGARSTEKAKPGKRISPRSVGDVSNLFCINEEHIYHSNEHH